VAESGTLLSVVVACYTMERLPDIRALLASLDGQDYPWIETVLVVERSRELYEELRGLPATGTARRVLWNGGEGGLSSNRNVGLASAHGEVIAFVDDDVVVDRAWAGEVVRCFEDATVGGVTGPAYPLWLEAEMSWLPEEFHWLVSCSSWTDWPDLREVRNAWGHNMAFARAAIEAAGPFSTSLGLRGGGGPLAEDTEYSLRLRSRTGKRIVYNPRALTWHRVHPYRLSGRFVRERSFAMGQSRAMMERFFAPEGGDDALGTERQLLGRIVGGLLPRTLGGLARHPGRSSRRLSLILASLSWLAMGYAWGRVVPGPELEAGR
jgi:cellulose synthase/poly-beta-1,6-N-acetylglucosamine synthase-like glycosyltransferase